MMGSINNVLAIVRTRGVALNKILAREAVKPRYDNEGLKRVFFEPSICSPRSSRALFLPFVSTKWRDSRKPETGSIYEKIVRKKNYKITLIFNLDLQLGLNDTYKLACTGAFSLHLGGRYLRLCFLQFAFLKRL